MSTSKKTWIGVTTLAVLAVAATTWILISNAPADEPSVVVVHESSPEISTEKPPAERERRIRPRVDEGREDSRQAEPRESEDNRNRDKPKRNPKPPKVKTRPKPTRSPPGRVM